MQQYYNDLRRQAYLDLLARRRRFFEKCPEAEALAAQLNAIYTKISIQDSEELRRQLSESTMALKKALTESGFEKDYLEIKYRCPDCNDTGFKQNQPCHCKRDGMSFHTFDDYSLEVFPQRERQAAERRLEYARQYVDCFPNIRPQNIILSGTTGVGKTFLLSCIAGELARKGFFVTMLTAYDFIQSIMDKVLGQRDYTYLKAMQNAEVLVLDDLGSEPFIPNVTIEYMFSTVNERYAHDRPTLIATNLSGVEIAGRYGKRVASRLHDVSATTSFVIKGEDLRMLHN